jgi:hypothetical protein
MFARARFGWSVGEVSGSLGDLGTFLPHIVGAITVVQILVIDDMLGLFTEFTPKLVKRYRRLGDEIRAAAGEHAEEVRQGRFPAAEHTYSR